MPLRYLFLIVSLAVIALLRVGQKQSEVEAGHELATMHRQMQEDAVTNRMLSSRIARELSVESLDRKIEIASLRDLLGPVRPIPESLAEPGDRAVAEGRQERE